MDFAIIVYICRSISKLRSEANKKGQAIKLWFLNKLFAVFSISFVLGGAIASFDIYVRSGMQGDGGYGNFTCIAEVFWISLYTFIVGLLMLLFVPKEALNSLGQGEDFVVAEDKDLVQ